MTAALLCAASRARAQATPVVPLGQSRTAQGLVQHPGANGNPVPAVHRRVVLHRVGQDSAGPLDSTFTDARGVYKFAYKTWGSPEAVYFASSDYDGIAYFTSPFQADRVTSPDGDIMVFDTTSSGIALQLQGLHVIVSAPQADGLRQVAEVFDIGNDGAKTRVARDDTTPDWVIALPADARSPSLAGGDIAAEAVTFAGHEARVFAPFSPGIRQLAIQYELPPSAFPLALPVSRPASALEVMVEETSMSPSLPGLAQQSSVSSQGRNFKRYLAQNVPAGAVLRIDAGGTSAGSHARFIAGTVFAMAVLLALALIVSMTRGSSPRAE